MSMNTAASTNRVLPAGISSNGRILPDVDGIPFKVSSSSGAHVVDDRGRSYVDYAMAMGASILGHAPPTVVEAICRAAANGPMPGFAHAGEEAAAEALTAYTGALRHATFVNTGSEAVHLACRVARKLTGRPMMVKAAGGFDGWYDEVSFGLSGSSEAGWHGSRPIRGQMTLLRYNDCNDVDSLFAERNDIAGVIVEPLLANAGCVEADPTFMRHLLAKARQAGAVVIADEVLGGLRLHPGLSSQKMGWSPDLATVGKAVGSGVPVAALIGTEDAFAPIISGSVARAGTYNGNPLVCAAVTATMTALASADYDRLLSSGGRLRSMIEGVFAESGVSVRTSGWNSVFSIWFASAPPQTYDAAQQLVSAERTLRLHSELRRQAILTMHSTWGRLFLSFAHDEQDFATTLNGFAAIARQFAGR
jgi:glutamate-1-semialdehyde 2,1-aminomutase